MLGFEATAEEQEAIKAAAVRVLRRRSGVVSTLATVHDLPVAGPAPFDSLIAINSLSLSVYSR